VTVVTSRFSRAGVHNPDVVSLGGLSGCGYGAGGVGGGDRGAGGWNGVADRAAGRREPVVGRGGGAGCASPEVFDSSMTITGPTFSAPTVSATEVAVQGTRRQGCYREFTR
jgi:hypothetical protein